MNPPIVGGAGLPVGGGSRFGLSGAFPGRRGETAPKFGGPQSRPPAKNLGPPGRVAFHIGRCWGGANRFASPPSPSRPAPFPPRVGPPAPAGSLAAIKCAFPLWPPERGFPPGFGNLGPRKRPPFQQSPSRGPSWEGAFLDVPRKTRPRSNLFSPRACSSAQNRGLKGLPRPGRLVSIPAWGSKLLGRRAFFPPPPWRFKRGVFGLNPVVEDEAPAPLPSGDLAAPRGLPRRGAVSFAPSPGSRPPLQQRALA